MGCHVVSCGRTPTQVWCPWWFCSAATGGNAVSAVALFVYSDGNAVSVATLLCNCSAIAVHAVGVVYEVLCL